MPSISKIPKSINEYAIKEAYKLRNSKIMQAKGLAISSDKIVMESPLIKGDENSILIDYTSVPRDILICNNLGKMDNSLSLNSIRLALSDFIPDKYKVDEVTIPIAKKLIMSNPEGFHAIDFTTVKKGVNSESMLDKLKGLILDLSLGNMRIGAKDLSQKEFNKLEKNMVDSFIKETGATHSEVKWSDYEKV